MGNWRLPVFINLWFPAFSRIPRLKSMESNLAGKAMQKMDEKKS